ncbi:carbohydrate ABC transporter permease [Alkalibacterium sp. 20]|uniref:carbohydrate ABC transporter permease n=1 Tax=Alkalibacterium sp. 20 TaxID=1798803 RepID=UPI0008FFE7B3|nr:carbohydrate ABC transporter permease [Alkalibacterium sp. 20]OJF94563.1 ABC transporter permease [Alkalibacterium sp. 20]
MKKENKTLKIIVYTILILYSLLTLFPFGWSILTSFKSTAEIASGGTFFPESWSISGWTTLFESQYTTWVRNSLVVALITTVLNVMFNTMAGYAFARIDFFGRKFLFSLMLLLIMIPGQVTMIPLYIVVSNLGLINTHSSIVLTSMINIAYIFMMRQFFINFPREVEEAASMDGLSTLGIFFKIVLPNAKPAIATQAIFIFMGVWNEFMRPLLFLTSPDKYMLTQGLNALSNQYRNITAWDIIMAGAIFSVIPIFIMFIFLNKYFISTNDRSVGSK